MAGRNFEPFNSSNSIQIKDEQVDKFGRKRLVERMVSFNNGLMHCTCNVKPICDHMWFVLLDENQSQPLKHGGRSDSVILSIPCFRYSKAMTPFWLTTVGNGLIEVRTIPVVEYQLAIRETTVDKAVLMDEPDLILGYISTDDGITSLLYLYADYFQAEVDGLLFVRSENVGQVMCPAPGHVRNNRELARMIVANGYPALAGEAYNVLALGKCSLCHKDTEEFDDLNDI